MRTFDLAPLYRSTVGFDRLFSMLDGFEAAPGYPPYNIERTGENDYRITVAVAGFGESELSIVSKENTLTIKGEKQVKQDNNGEVLYQGIAARAFERQFQLADYVQVKGANLENGLLHVELVREIPEAKKPRQIAIANGSAKAQVVEAPLDPRIGLQRRRTESLHPALRQRAMGGIDLLDGIAVRRQHPHEGRVDVGGIAEGVEAVADAGLDRAATNVLQVDGDFGAGDVDAERRFATT